MFSLKKYRPNLDNLMITNVDSRNIYSAFTFEEKDKKDRLINKLLDWFCLKYIRLFIIYYC